MVVVFAIGDSHACGWSNQWCWCLGVCGFPAPGELRLRLWEEGKRRLQRSLWMVVVKQKELRAPAAKKTKGISGLAAELSFGWNCACGLRKPRKKGCDSFVGVLEWMR